MAACVLPVGDLPPVADSKTLARAEREALAPAVAAAARWGIGSVGPDRIDEVGILAATMEAMRLAHASAGLEPGIEVVVDGDRLPGLDAPERALVRADATEPEVAAASILAKVARDALLAGLGRLHPGYGLGRHAGYGTPAHLDALARLGPTPAHRRSFRPVALATMLS